MPNGLRLELGGVLHASAHGPDSSTANGVDVAGIVLGSGYRRVRLGPEHLR
jgi:hypothetical protein